MPELPEITTIVNQLQKEIVGSKIAGVQVVGNYRIQFNSLELVGRKVTGVKRIAKNIVIELGVDTGHGTGDTRHVLPVTCDLFLIIHLTMTGRLLLRSAGRSADPWTRLVFHLQPDGLNSTRRVRELRFCDSRMFGSVKLMSQDELEQYSGKYGPDALDENLTPEIFLNQLKKKRTAIKRALLEQEIIAGAGNIYVNDSLWLAGIHPETMTDQLNGVQTAGLLSALQTILREGIEHRGSTLGDKMYIDIYGQEGEHQNYFRVFGKNGQACPRCAGIINYIDIGGRGTFFCPNCQKKLVGTKLKTSNTGHETRKKTGNTKQMTRGRKHVDQIQLI